MHWGGGGYYYSIKMIPLIACSTVKTNEPFQVGQTQPTDPAIFGMLGGHSDFRALFISILNTREVLCITRIASCEDFFFFNLTSVYEN